MVTLKVLDSGTEAPRQPDPFLWLVRTEQQTSFGSKPKVIDEGNSKTPPSDGHGPGQTAVLDIALQQSLPIEVK